MANEPDELVELLDGLAYIIEKAKLGRGLDDASNAAFNSIRARAERLVLVARAATETKQFSPEERFLKLTKKRSIPPEPQLDHPQVAS